MKTRAIAIARESVEPGFRHAPRASRSAMIAILLAVAVGLTSLAGTAISLVL